MQQVEVDAIRTIAYSLPEIVKQLKIANELKLESLKIPEERRIQLEKKIG